MHLICPKNFAQAFFSISLGTAVITRRNKKQNLGGGVGGGQIRCNMGNVEVAYPPVKKKIKLKTKTKTVKPKITKWVFLSSLAR